MIPHFAKRTAAAVMTIAAMTVLSATGAHAATLTVPSGTYPTIAAALTAANTGDDIRVDSTFTETSTQNAVSGKVLTIASYDSTFTTPTTGAKWVLASGGGGNNAGLIQLTNSTLTFNGFSQVTVPAASAFYLGAASTLTVNDTTFSGIASATSAAIYSLGTTPTFSTDSNVTVNNCTFSANARCIWFQNAPGTTSLTINNSTFLNSTNSVIEYRTGVGTHTFNMSRSTITQAAGNAFRLTFLLATTTSPINAVANVDRCKFTQTSTTLSNMFAINSVATGGSNNALSSADINITNCIFDQRLANVNSTGIATVDTSGAPRKANINVKHCTFLLNSATQAGTYAGTDTVGAWSIQNSIFSGAGTAIKAAATLTATVSSGKNLFDTTTASSGSNITLSGTEISGSPAFVGSSDFHLTAGSPAVNVGTASAVSTDYDGLPRPVNAPDLGAYEYQVATAVSDWTMY